MRLIDSDAEVYGYVETWICDCSEFGRQSVMAVEDISYLPEIDPETLPIVLELREKLNRVTAERDAAVKQLHGYCAACKNYTENHCDGPCEECKHEYYIYRDAKARDNWEWRGPDGDHQ